MGKRGGGVWGLEGKGVQNHNFLGDPLRNSPKFVVCLLKTIRVQIFAVKNAPPFSMQTKIVLFHKIEIPSMFYFAE